MNCLSCQLRTPLLIFLFLLSTACVRAQGLLPTDREVYENIPTRAEFLHTRQEISNAGDQFRSVRRMSFTVLQSGTPLPESDSASAEGEVAQTNANSGELPESVDLRPFLPVPGVQHKNDCVAWAIAYTSYSCQISQERGYQKYTGRDVDTFNPAYLYSKMAPNGEALNVVKAAQYAQQSGCASLATMPWNSAKRSERADNEAEALRAGQLFRAENLDDIRHFLADGYPVMMAIFLDDTFHSKAVGTQPYRWTPGGKQNRHAVCAVGYDRKSRTVLVMNSYGTDWKDGGFCQVDEREFAMINDQHWCSEAYVLEIRRAPPITVQVRDAARRSFFGKPTPRLYQLRSDRKIYKSGRPLSPESWSVEDVATSKESLYVLRDNHVVLRLNDSPNPSAVSWTHLDRGPLLNEEILMMAAVPGSKLHVLSKDGELFRLEDRPNDWAEWEAVTVPSGDGDSNTVVDLRDDGIVMTAITVTGDTYTSSTDGQWTHSVQQEPRP